MERVAWMPRLLAAAMSRLLGGYHVRVDNEEGLVLGRKIATYSWPKYQAYFDGTAVVRP